MPDGATQAAIAAPDMLIEMTTELVACYVAGNALPGSDMPSLIATVHASRSGLGRPTPDEIDGARPTPPVPVRKTVTEDYIVSLDDGRPYQSLERHLTKHGLTSAEYRARWDLPPDYPMVAAVYSAKRSALAKETGLGARRRTR